MKLLSILKKDLLILVRNKVDMLVLFLMPLAFIIPISLALGSGDGYGVNRDNRMIALPIINYDGGPRAQDFTASIGESLFLELSFNQEQVSSLGLGQDPDCAAGISRPACHEKAARALVQQSQRRALLIIPEGFTQAVDDGLPAQVSLVYDPSADAIQLRQIEGVVQGAALKLSVQKRVNSGLRQLTDLVAYAPIEVQQSLQDEAALQPPAGQKPALSIRKVFPENSRLSGAPDTYQQTIPGYSVMYVFFIITSMAGSIRQEKLNGTFRRLLSAPISRAELLGGKLLATMIVGMAQVILLFLAGTMLFGLGLGSDPLAFLVLTAALVLAAATLGLAVSATRLKGAGLAAPLVIAALLGGCMFPLDLMPPFLRALSAAVPHSWALQGYQNLLVRGQTLQDILPQAGALLGFAVLFFLFAIWRFRFDDQEAGV